MDRPTSLASLRPNRTRTRAAGPGRTFRLRNGRLRVERLEDRCTPSVSPGSPLELDGNVTTTTAHDWDQIFADASPLTNGDGSFSNGATSGALVGSFDTDAVNSNTDDIFQGGGSKDTLGIQAGKWLYTGSKPQGKDDITHAYASAYVDGNGHLILYAAMDRYDNSGDSTAGFWFFKNNIGQNPNVTQNGGHPFTGTHSDGDILLVSDFTVGGSTSTIKVFRWTGNDATGSLVALNNGNPINGNTFAVVNSGPISVPWAYTNKSGQHQPAAGEFLEEGVDLTALGLQGCFSSFLAETRSSQSPTATLSDFVLGNFPLCSLGAPQFTGLSKFDTATNQGDLVTYPLTVQNTGAMPLYIQSVTDTLLGNIVVNHTLQAPGAVGVTAITSGFDFSQPLAVGASLTILVTRQVQATDPDPTFNTTTFVGTDDLAGTEDPISVSVTDSVNLFQPSATLTEVASPTAGVAGTPITYTYTVSNTSSSDSPNLVLDPGNPNGFFTDTLFPNIESDAIAAAVAAGFGSGGVMSLPAGKSFSFTETRAIQTGDPTPLTDSSSAGFTFFDSTHFPNVIHAQASTSTRIVNARISIAPSATNEVGQPHTFTVTVLQDDGLPAGAPGGDAVTGFGPASGANVTVALTSTNGANGVPSTPLTGTTNSSGQFAVTFTSATAGRVIGNATTTLSVSGVSLTRATGDSNAGDGGPATKTFVDGRISIAPNATNGITEPHTFTVTVVQNAGDGNGFTAAAGASVTVTLTGAGGAVPIASTPLTGTTDGSGQFSVTFTSDSAGQVAGNATAALTVGGVSLTRATGDSHAGDGGPATKTFVSGSLRWKKVDEAGNLLGGATFLVTTTGGTAASAGHTPLSVTVLDNGPFDADPTPGLFSLKPFQAFAGSALTGLALGTYSVRETVAPAGYTLDPKVLSATLTLAAPNADLSGTPFVDTLPHLTITKTVTGGGGTAVIHPGDTASFTITVSNDGAGTATNVQVTDQLPEAALLSWTVTSSTFDTASLSTTDFLTAVTSALPGGATVTVIVSAVVPLDFFGTEGGGTGTGNGDPVPLNLFELDGNATTGVLGTSGSTTTSHDWDQVFADNAVNPPTSTAAALASSFVNDKINTTADDIFTGGGSKDPNAIGQWQFKNGKPQGKDDIENAFAALYKDPATDDQILYAGLTRYDNSGDATAGFWFFVNPVSEAANGTFTGTHSDGDILLVSDFTVGGSLSTIKVFKWSSVPVGGSNLVLLNNGNLPNGTTFAIVNGGPVSVPWAYTNKSGQHQPAAGEFLEEGINLTGLGLNGCFSSFLAETRSSQSPTATLSDLVLGRFETCEVPLPNTASVKADNFNNGQPITSNQAVITINDGHALGATAAGPGAAAALSADQVQPVVAQAVAVWQAAGVGPAELGNLANTAVKVGDLPGGELGYFTPGTIWIDPTAAGWGWSTTGDPGRMDLRTVLVHEMGHALGFDHDAGGAMEPALAPGVQLLPVGSGIGTAAAALPADTGTGSGAPVTFLTPSRTAAFDTAVAVVVHDSLVKPVSAGEPDVAGGPAAVPANLGPQVPAALFAPVAVLTLAPAVSDESSRSPVVPGLWPPDAEWPDSVTDARPFDDPRNETVAEWVTSDGDSTSATCDTDVAAPIAVD